MEEIAVVIVTNVDVPVFFVCSVIHSKSLAKQQVAIFSEDEKNKISFSISSGPSDWLPRPVLRYALK